MSDKDKRKEAFDEAVKAASMQTQSSDENWKRQGIVNLFVLKETFKDK